MAPKHGRGGGKSKKGLKNSLSGSSTAQLDSKVETDEEHDPKSPITYSGLDSAFNKHLNPIVTALQASLDSVTLVGNNALALVEKLEERVKTLEKENKELKKNVNDNTKDIKRLEEKIEDRTNRQLRKTLVFRGVPEIVRGEGDAKKLESWEETEALLAEKVAEVCGIQVEEAAKKLERVHRSAPNPRYEGGAPRPIFAACYDWKFSEHCKKSFKDENIKKKTKTTCEQKYGPLTTARRNLAMQERRKLLNGREIVSGYLAFPAQLMVRKTSEGKFFYYKDFSKNYIKFDEKD